jgi:hypothetical protein
VEPPAYALQSHLNYSRYARYADLDALIEVYGQVRADNPASLIRILPSEELTGDFALNHLIFIGGAAVAAAYFGKDIPLPTVRPTDETHIFKCSVGEETREFASASSKLEDGVEALEEDVGLIARIRHPIISQRTVTMLSGITSRGVHGAALCLTDSHVKDANEQYLKNAFGTAGAFCVVMRVMVGNNTALPSNLLSDSVRLYEWSTDTGARW